MPPYRSSVKYRGSWTTARGTRVSDRRGLNRNVRRWQARARPGYRTVARTRGWAAAGEMKYFDTFLASTALVQPVTWDTTEFDPATFLTFCVPVKGTGINQRIGREIRLHKFKLRGQIRVIVQANQTATDGACQVRMLLVLDTQTNATQIAGENVMEAPGTASAANNCMTFMNLDSLGRYRILKDKTMVLTNPNLAWDGTNMEQQGLVKPFKINHTFKNPVAVHFNAANGGTIADIVDNSLHLLIAATNIDLAPTVLYEARVSYKDPQ